MSVTALKRQQAKEPKNRTSAIVSFDSEVYKKIRILGIVQDKSIAQVIETLVISKLNESENKAS